MIINKLILSATVCTCILLGGCNSRSDIEKSYDLGASDTSKTLYWAMQNVHKSESYNKKESATYRTIELPVDGKNKEGNNYAPHFVKVRVIETP